MATAPKSNPAARTTAETHRKAVRETAIVAHKNGLCALPLKKDGQKSPDLSWAEYVDRLPTDEENHRWFGNGQQDGIWLACGPVSNDLYLFEIDADFDADRDLFQTFIDTAESLGFEFLDWLRSGYEELTPGGGRHWLAYVPGLQGQNNEPLAKRPKLPEEKSHPKDNTQTLIEIRGKGGGVVIAPSGGRSHPSEKPYELISGSLKTIHTLTVDEWGQLKELGRSFDRMQQEDRSERPEATTVIEGTRPGDDFNQRVTWSEILTPDGWTLKRHRGDVDYWARPGKSPSDGHSATTNVYGIDRLKVFTSSTDLEENKTYSKFEYIAATKHGGDFAAAAKALHKEGYGSQRQHTKPNSNGAKPPDEAAGDDEDDPRQFELTDSGNVERLLADHGQDILRCDKLGGMLFWNGRYWEVDEAGHTHALIKESNRKIFAQAATEVDQDTQKKIVKYGMQSQNAKAIRDAYYLLGKEPRINTTPEQFDANPWLLNVLNGTLDLRTGEIRAPSRDDRITRIIPFEYHPATPCATWSAFLDDVLEGDAGLKSHLQRAVGYSLTGSTRDRVAMILHGMGRNGKSTFLDVLLKVFGPYATEVPIDTFLTTKQMDSNVMQHTALLRGSRFAVSSEADEGRRIAEATLKRLTGGDSLRGKFLYKDSFNFDPTHTLWIGTNHKPTISGTDNAIWDRIRLVPFNVRFFLEHEAGPNTPKNRIADPSLKDKLLAEAEGILAWSVAGAVEWYQKGLGMPDAVREATSEYRLSEDVVGRFIDERCFVSNAAKASAASLFITYTEWCDLNGESKPNQRKFGRSLTERGFQRVKSGTYIWHGIGLLDPDGQQPHDQQEPGDWQ